MQTEPSLHLGDYASLFYNASHSGQMCFIGITQLFGAIVLKGIFKVNLMKNKRAQSTFSIPKTVVFYRNFEICMLHVSLSPVLSTLNILGARFPFKTMILSHTELFSFFLSFFKTSTVKSQLGEENWKLLLFISLTDIHHLHFFFPSRSLVFIALIDESALTFDLCCLLGKHWMLMQKMMQKCWKKNHWWKTSHPSFSSFLSSCQFRPNKYGMDTDTLPILFSLVNTEFWNLISAV